MDRSSPLEPSNVNEERFNAAWRAHRSAMVGLALRMTGNISDAEDAVQEAFARLSAAQAADEIDDARAWLVVVVSRICLDQLRSAHSRRVDLTQLEGPEPVAARRDEVLGPSDRLTLDDSVRLAMLRVLEQLTPAERVVFVLHDVFQFPFPTVATIVGRTPAACRQLAGRARHRVETEATPARFSVDAAEQNRVAECFVAACAGSDLQALIRLLDPNVVGVAERGRFIRLRPISGSNKVAKRLFKLFSGDDRITLVSMPGAQDAGVIAFRDRRIVGVLTLSTHDGLINHIHALVDRRKLKLLGAALDATSHDRPGSRPRKSDLSS